MKNLEKKGKTNKGITLIALVITIIVLLILAAVSIATLTGENGILSKANRATEENKKAEYEEILKLIGNGLRPDKVINSWSAKKYLDEYEDKIPEEENFKEAKIERKTDEMILVTTKEKWVYRIKEGEVKYLGTEDKIIAPDLQNTDVIFTPSKSTWTNQNITMAIESRITGYILEYSTDGQKWNTYTDPIPISENQTIYARLNSIADFSGASASKKIDWIDKVDPTGEISIDTIGETEVTVSVKNISDKSQDTRYGSSGIDKIRYTINDGKTTTVEVSEKSHTFTGLVAGTKYNITITIFDKAGNSCVLTSEATTKLIKWLVQNGVVVDQSIAYYNASEFQSNQGSYAYCQSSHNSYWSHSGLYWNVQGMTSNSKVVVQWATSSPNSNIGTLLFCSADTGGEGWVPSFNYGTLWLTGGGADASGTSTLNVTGNPSQMYVGFFHYGTRDATGTQRIYVYNMRIES